MADLRDKRVELILQQLEELPTLPAVAVRVLQVTADDSASAADVVRLIGSDPALTARILQLTRRADRGVRDDVRSIDRAVVLLGFDAVRNAVLAVSVFQALGAPKKGTVPFFSREEFWKHCLAVACCAELLAEVGGPAVGVSPADAFLCGLLHDLGKLALDVALPKSYARVVEAADLLRGDIADLERTVIGIDHQIAGKRLAERWQLPPAVRDAAWLHGQPPAALPAAVKAPLINLVTLADVLVRQQHIGYSGNHNFAVSIESLLTATRLSTKDVDEAMGALGQRMEPRSAALGLGETTGETLYRQALAQANRELGRVSHQLAAKSKRLWQRSQFFDVVQQFQHDLRPDAAVPQVLSAIAAAAAGMIGAGRVAAFSLAPAHDYAEAVLCDGDGATLETTLVELPGMSGLTESAPLSEEDLRAAQALYDCDPATPSPGTPGEGRGGGSRGEAATVDRTPVAGNPHPNPPPEYRERGPDGVRGAGGDATIAIPLNAASSAPSPLPGDGPVLPAGDNVEWLTGSLSSKLDGVARFWICLQAEGACIGGVVWGAAPGEADRLLPQAQELSALGHGWALALRMSQVREDARTLAEELADANRRLHAAQDVFLRTRALTTVGEMAAGAAHEMNNPLAVISGRSQLLARQLEDPKQQAAAKLIHEQADRLSDIITEMMAFAKPQPPVMQPSDVRSIIQAAADSARSLADAADRTIDVTVGLVPPALVDPGQIAAALAEVIANAIQATAAPGRIEIRADHDPWSSQVVVTVTDEGTGMNEPTLKRAFDPFYSNKPAGRRRGLGLPKALRWVEANGGSIRLESQLGKGSRAVLLLPAAASSDAADRGDNAEPRRIGGDAKPLATAADEGVQERIKSGQPAGRG